MLLILLDGAAHLLDLLLVLLTLLLLQAFDLAEERVQLRVELGLWEVDGGGVYEARLEDRIGFTDAADGKIGDERGLGWESCI